MHQRTDARKGEGLLSLAIKHHLRRESATPIGKRSHIDLVCITSHLYACRNQIHAPKSLVNTVPNVSYLSACWTVVKSARTTLDGLLLGDGDNVDWDRIEL